MHIFLRNLLAIIVGLIAGLSLNMGLIMLGPILIAPPPGGDITTEAGLKATLHLFEPKHFIFPFLAHALGTLIGAIITLVIAKDHKAIFAYIIGGLFLIAGIMNVVILPAPMWFNIVDLVFAYLPMAYLSTKFIKNK